MTAALRRIATLAALCLGSPVWASGAAESLSRDPAWLALLHFPGQVGESPGRSLVRTPEFFLSDSGSVDPAAEMRASLRLFEQELEDGLDDRDWRVCRFPARFRFLARRFPERLAESALQDCPDYQGYRGFVRPVGVSLIFVSPAKFSMRSAFGHLLLRFDRGPFDSDERLLDPAVHYFVPADEPAAPEQAAFDWRSRYQLESYAEVYIRYAGYRNRDLWEYELNLSPDQIDAIVDKAYELPQLRFKYSYVVENCVTELLRLLRVSGHPDLTRPFAYTERITPLALVQALDERGLVRRRHHRPPDPSGIIPAREAALSAPLRRTAFEIARDDSGIAEFNSLSREQQAAVLDLAIDYRRLRLKDAGRWDPGMIPPELAVLLDHRRKLPPTPTPDPSPPFDPLQSHAMSRVELAGLAVRGGANGMSLGYRGAGHGLEDPAAGRPTQYTGGLIEIRVDLDPEDDLRLDSLSFLSSRDLPTPLAGIWQWAEHSSLAIDRLAQDSLSLSGEWQYGRAVQLPLAGRAIGFGLGGASLRAGEDLDQHFQVAAAADLGMLWASSVRWTHLVEASWRQGIAGDTRDYWRLSASTTLRITRNLALRAELRRGATMDTAAPEDGARISLYRYF